MTPVINIRNNKKININKIGTAMLKAIGGTLQNLMKTYGKKVSRD